MQLLKGSIPGYVVNQFRKTVQSEVNFKFVPVNQIYDLFKQLQNWQQPDANNKEGWSRLIPFRQNQKVTKSDLVTL
ncbi:MAG: polyamine ABC transporter substrate-binding protein, partial [Sphaerospermopsis kisseleviana]